MEIVTNTNHGLEHRIHLLDTPLGRDHVNIQKPNPEGDKKLLESHRAKYESDIYIPDWKEVLFGIKGHYSDVNLDELGFVHTTSYQMQALRRGKEVGILPITIEGLVLTRDNKFVFGLRDGKAQNGKLGACPTGSLSYFHGGNNPLFTSFYHELVEELGVDYSSEDTARLIGYQTDPDFTKGINFVFYLPIGETSSELDKMHKEAYGAYQKALLQGASEEEARETIKNVGFTNVDAWEHSKLIFMNNNSVNIGRAIENRNIKQDNVEYPLLDILRGSLIMYANMDYT